MKSHYSSVFETVKNTFQKMSFSSDRNQESLLVRMNIPAHMARRDAAYDMSVYLIRKPLFSYKEEERSEIYKSILKLLNIALDATKLIDSPGAENKKTVTRAMYQYMLILNDTVQAAANLLRHELILLEDGSDLSGFMGSDISTQFKSADEVFSNSEMNIYHCINDLIDLAENTIIRYRELWKKSFSKSNHNRYMKAFNEFNKLYAKYNSLDNGDAVAPLEDETADEKSATADE